MVYLPFKYYSLSKIISGVYMKKYVFWAALLSIFLGMESAMADMPTYDDDEEFKHCTKVTGDWDNCTRESTLRTLDDVKRGYRSILSNKAILGWQETPQKNAETLRDMFESWTAFRNRLCSLSYKASMYIEPLVDERYSCSLYYALHHKDHINSILQLLEKKAPPKRADFHFLDLTSHDEQYGGCAGGSDNDKCIKEELSRSSQAIKDLYKSFINDEFVGKWNNGPSLQQGNYRDMYDSWVAYRNRICSLAIWAYQREYGPEAPSLEQCLQFYNREKLETMENLLVVAHSSLDQGMEDDEDGGEGLGGSSSLPEIVDDGGEAVGKTIPPLQKRISSGSSPIDDELVKTYNRNADKNETQDVNSQHKVPAWAR